MKKVLLASTVVLSVAVLGGGWYIVEHRDPLQQAKVLLAKGDYRSAGLQLRTAVRDSPSNAEAHSLLAQLYIASDDAVAAEHEIRQAMNLNWDQASSLAVLSQALMRQSKWAEILQQVPEKGSTPEQTAYYLMTRAVAQRGLKDNTTSTATLAEAERLAPQNAEVHLVASRFAQQDGQLDLALDQVNRSLAIEPLRTDALQFKSSLLLAKGDRANALAELTKAIDGAPTRLDLLVERGALLLAINEDSKAKSDIATVLARDPKNVPARFVSAVLHIREGKFAEADTELQRIDPVI
ncbi:MAG: tetratricopeptide repeat protein, partial [Oxalobacteraceae bacterium]